MTSGPVKRYAALLPRGQAFCLSVCCILFGAASPGLATDVAILKSAEVDYYDQAVQGIRSVLPSQIDVKEYPLGGSLAQGRKIGVLLRAAPPDLVLAVGLKATLVAKLELPDTPVVFCLVLNPEQHGLPFPNMTGIQTRLPADAQLKSLRSILPMARHVGVLYDPNQNSEFIRSAQEAAKQLDLELTALPVHSPDEVDAHAKILLKNTDALWVMQDRTVVTETTIPGLIQSSLAAKVPLFTFSSTLVQQGAFGALVIDAWTVGRQAGRIASSILRHESAADGHVLDPEQPQLALNLRSAERLGMTFPSGMVRMAGQLYSGAGPVAGQLHAPDLFP
jgi:putative ABC transport system substrate-binding protein